MFVNAGEYVLRQLLQDAADHLAHRRYKEAHAACLEALQIDPQNAQAFYLLGVLAADHANHRKACELFDKAIALAPETARYHAERARSRVALFDRDGALDDARVASEGQNVSGRTSATIGVVYSRLGLHAEAVPFFRAAVESDPENEDFLYNLGAALQFVGRMDEAAAAFRKVIALDPKNVRAWSSLVLMQKQTALQNDIAQLEGLFERLSGADERLHIGHALAKTFEDLGNPDAAMSWLGKAKALKSQTIPHDTAALDGLFAAAAANTELPASKAGHPDPSPIFIVGLPRTGTTLLDRVLSSHDQVSSAGELSDFALALKWAAGTPSNHVLDVETLSAASRLDLAQVGERYIARARRVVGDAQRFVDKMPLNFFYVPVILAALPNARIICLRRNPADTVLSNYRQLFATSFSHYNYAYDLAWTADYYVRFERLIAHFRDKLSPARFTEVWYEDLVANLESEARRLVDFCGLDWQQQCVSFHENAAPVATASASQVRQPLYASSVHRWRRYQAHIQPALKVFAEQGIRYA